MLCSLHSKILDYTCVEGELGSEAAASVHTVALTEAQVVVALT